mmetsp:Transcript_2900/g.7903  ORF Transcript_2900/g.7903 Transcript_2900/m.7903 type:complete len:82 (+) Transcript_2900:1720-1965(+)
MVKCASVRHLVASRALVLLGFDIATTVSTVSHACDGFVTCTNACERNIQKDALHASLPLNRMNIPTMNQYKNGTPPQDVII